MDLKKKLEEFDEYSWEIVSYDYDENGCKVDWEVYWTFSDQNKALSFFFALDRGKYDLYKVVKSAETGLTRREKYGFNETSEDSEIFEN